MSVTGRTASQSSELAANLASMPARSRYATATFPALTRRCTGQVSCEKLSPTPPALTTTTRLTLRFSMARVSTDATRVVKSGGDSSFANGLRPARRMPMHETTASCSSTAASRNAGSVTSPLTTERFRRPVSRLSSCLTTAVTEWPASAARAITHWPTPPDAPRTTSRMATNLEVATRQTRAARHRAPRELVCALENLEENQCVAVGVREAEFARAPLGFVDRHFLVQDTPGSILREERVRVVDRNAKAVVARRAIREVVWRLVVHVETHVVALHAGVAAGILLVPEVDLEAEPVDVVLQRVLDVVDVENRDGGAEFGVRHGTRTERVLY